MLSRWTVIAVMWTVIAVKWTVIAVKNKNSERLNMQKINETLAARDNWVGQDGGYFSF